jgi:hypothetical protein
MPVPMLARVDETYCLLRSAGASARFAAWSSRGGLVKAEADRIGAVNEASPFIQLRYRELGRPDLIRADCR